MDPDSFFKVVSLTKSYGNYRVLHDVSLQLKPGDIVSIIGRSGAGKSTLLRCMNLLETFDSGYILFKGELLGVGRGSDGTYSALSERALSAQRRQIGMVFQSFNLFPHMRALENVAEALVTVKRLSRADANAIAVAQLERVGLKDKLKSYPRELSGGQQQRVAIARALAMEPAIMLFDEPTSALDPGLVAEVLTVIQELAGSGMTLVIVTHEMKFARTISSRVVVMADGRIIDDGSPEQIFRNGKMALPSSDELTVSSTE